MEVKTITVNRTPERPDGINIDVVVPQGETEAQVVAFLLNGFLQHARQSGRLKMDLPERFSINYQSEGSFLVSSEAGPSPDAPYYNPPRPLAIVAVQRWGNRYDLAYAEVKQSTFAARSGPGPQAQPDSIPPQAAEPNNPKS